MSSSRAAVDVDVREVVLGAELLRLLIDLHQWPGVPEPDVLLDFGALHVVERQLARGSVVRAHLDLVEPERMARRLDVVRDVLALQLLFVRPDFELRDDPRIEPPPDDQDDEIGHRDVERGGQPVPQHADEVDDRRDQTDDEQDP